MNQCILTPKSMHPQRQMFYRSCCSLPMHQIPVCEGILQQRSNCVDVVLRHLPNVLKHEGKALQHPILHVQFLHSVLIHQGWQHSEWTTGFRHYCNGNRSANTQLPLLHLQIVQKSNQYVLWPNCLRYVPKCLNRCSPYAFLMRLKHLQQVETYPYPLLWRHLICTLISYLTHQLYTILLHLLITVFKNWGQPRQQILDGRSHLDHPHLCHYAAQCPQNTPQHLRVFLSQTFIEVQPQPPQTRFLPTYLHRVGNFSHQVCCLLPNPYTLVIESPVNGTNDLHEVGFSPQSIRIHHCSKPIQYHCIVSSLLMKRSQYCIHQVITQLLRRIPQLTSCCRLGNFSYCLHHHLPIRLVLILQPKVQSLHYLSCTHLNSYFSGCLNQLLIVSAVKGHASHPKTSEEFIKNLFPQIKYIHPITPNYLLQYLKNNLPQLLLRCLKLPYQGRHNGLDVLRCMPLLHQGEYEPHCLNECPQRFVPDLSDALPKRLKYGVKCLDAVRGSSFSQGRYTQCSHTLYFLLLIIQPMLDNLHQLLKVRQNRAPHQYSNLLHCFNTSVTSLPVLLRGADCLQEGQYGGQTKGRTNDSEGTRSGVAYKLVLVVDVWAHGRNHRWQTSCLGQIRHHLPPLHPRIVVLVDEHRQHYHQNLVHVRSHLVIQLVQNTVYHLHQQVPLLWFSGSHQQGQNAVEEGSWTKLPCIDGDLPKRCPSHLRVTVFDLQKQCKYLPLLLLLYRKLVLIHLLEEGRKELILLRFDLRQVSLHGFQHLLRIFCLWHSVPFCSLGRVVVLRHLQHLEAIVQPRQYLIEVLISEVTIAELEFSLPPQFLQLGRRHLHDVRGFEVVRGRGHASVGWCCPHQRSLVLPLRSLRSLRKSTGCLIHPLPHRRTIPIVIRKGSLVPTCAPRRTLHTLRRTNHTLLLHLQEIYHIYLYMPKTPSKILHLLLLSTILCCCLGADDVFKLIAVADASALCLDGSPSAYYLLRNDPTKIVLSFEGGGWCGEADLTKTLQSCYQRSKGSLGSSHNYPATMVMKSGFLSNQSSNYFANWTKVYLKYCDGSGHQGTRSNPVLYKDAKLYFRGNNITVAQLNSLNDRIGLFTTVTHIVVAGQSAGGLATFLWTNYISDRVQKSAKVWSIPDSGVFFDSVSLTTKTNNYRNGFLSLMKLANEEIDPPTKECVAAYPDEKVKCLFAQYLHPFIRVPLFSVQSLYDSWSIPNILNIGCAQNLSLGKCNGTDRQYIEEYRNNVTKMLFQSTESNANGFWAPACLYHVFTLNEAYANPSFTVPQHSDYTASEAITKWIQGVTENPRHVDYGEWPINAPCSNYHP